MSFFEDNYDEYISSCYESAYSDLEMLESLSDETFLDYVTQANPERLNSLSFFPAHTIASRIKESGKKMTRKQRVAITNVYIFTLYNVNVRAPE